MSAKKTNASFEAELEKLEELVSKLEGGEIPLEESLKLFEEGVELYKSCKKRMGSIEVKINKLTDSMKEESLEE
tara:strand:- start:15888 stop:16109 length:222 start_codon:yes stop_codon:yes gene_type:complete